MKKILLLLFFCGSLSAQNMKPTDKNIPRLETRNYSTQLIVDNKPFIILGGEVGNSTFTSTEYMAPLWPKFKAMNLNTILAPVYWELIEPDEGKFNFRLYDKLIEEAGKNDLKLVLLWFGSWKNSMSSHAPAWVKLDQERFPRVRDDKGKSYEILTPFSKQNLEADKKAFRALMKHIKQIDRKNHTVIMAQPENEIGMLPTARDYSIEANKKFYENVPAELMLYLVSHKGNLVPEFEELWAKNGYKESGTWEEVFGKGLQTDEIFMAWYYAKFTNSVAAAGKEEYPLPMYVNAALNRPGRLPGSGYPSAGPLPHIMDVWLAGAPDINFLSPDFYNPDLKHWCDLYTRRGNPLFIPEHAFDNTVVAKTAYVFGHYEAIGFSPFSIESKDEPGKESLGKIYDLLRQITPLFAANQGKHKIDGVLFDKTNQESVIRLGDYEFTFRHSYTLGYEPGSKDETWENTGALIIQTGENEFYLAGSGIVTTFKNIKHPELNVGILKAEQGKFENNTWKVIRHLNGDQTHQGRHIRILLSDGFFIQRFELYNYR